MGRSRKRRGGVGPSDESPYKGPSITPYTGRSLDSFLTKPSSYSLAALLGSKSLRPTYESPSASITPDPLLSEAIIEKYKPTCGEFTKPIPGIKSDLTWKQLKDLSTPQLTWEEERVVTDPHELYRSLLGADGSLLKALSDSLNEGELLPLERTNEMKELLSGWMDIRRKLGLPPILGLDGVEITVDTLMPLSCRLTIRSDLDEYSNIWRVVASFVQARPDIFKAVFAEALIPSAIAGGYGGLSPCLEGFCHYALLKMRDAITTCFPSEDRTPTVPPMSGVLKMRRGRTIVSAFLEAEGARIAGPLTIEPFRAEIMGILRTTHPDVDWTDDDISNIFEYLRGNPDAYVGGKTRRKRRKTKHCI